LQDVPGRDERQSESEVTVIATFDERNWGLRAIILVTKVAVRDASNEAATLQFFARESHEHGRFVMGDLAKVVAQAIILWWLERASEGKKQ
jgi:hypothetical protein